MFSSRHTTLWAAVLATTTLLLAADPARAQGPGGYYYETFRYGYNPGYYARRYAVPPPEQQGAYFGAYRATTKTAPGPVSSGAWLHYAVAPAAPQRTGGYAPTVTGTRRTEAVDTVARIELRVPAGAEVWLDGVPTRQTGDLRLFVSPPLTPGKEYVYALRVTWSEGEAQKAESRDLTIRAGDLLSATVPALGR
jgi:uncharacterized protein (TIGR03000 family)